MNEKTGNFSPVRIVCKVWILGLFFPPCLTINEFVSDIHTGFSSVFSLSPRCFLFVFFCLVFGCWSVFLQSLFLN